MTAALPLGTFARAGDFADVQFDRFYAHPIDKVWRALTDPERLADWMGVSTVEAFVGGKIAMMIGSPGAMQGEILIWDAPNVLEFTWRNPTSPEAIVRYALTAEGAGTRMIFTHTHMPYTSSARMMPGWHWFFDRLGAALTGTAAAGLTYEALQDQYVAAYELSGVRLGHCDA